MRGLHWAAFGTRGSPQLVGSEAHLQGGARTRTKVD